ncbi:hypothetical protein FH972_026507 [Carpinus fangiana]|uniref:Uncharacterized protein n=1 Tax=Carpinus fangiana TaxID=176857 RepID=A0A5N6L467_9ROSI|nr:hypothetical protein FH972_026507 [Carpinus fangiana]
MEKGFIVNWEAQLDVWKQAIFDPKAKLHALAQLPAGAWPGLLANVVVTGGTALLPGFVERLQAEVRSLAPAQCVVRVRAAEGAEVVKWTWLGGARLATADGGQRLREVSVTKAEYDEMGAGWVTRKFNGTGKPVSVPPQVHESADLLPQAQVAPVTLLFSALERPQVHFNAGCLPHEQVASAAHGQVPSLDLPQQVDGAWLGAVTVVGADIVASFGSGWSEERMW